MKNTTFKRLLAAMLAIVMLLSLVACGDPAADNDPEKEPASTQGGNDPVETAAPTEPALGLLDPYPETVTLTFSRLLDHASTYPEGVTNDNNGYVKMIKDVLNIECVTAFEANSGEDYDRLTSLAIASEEIPDVLYIYGNGSGSGLSLVKELYENELIMPLDEVYEAYADEVTKANYASYGDPIWNGVTFEGQKYALPYAAGDFYPMIWIRADWLEKLNLNPDEDGNGIITREDLAAVAKAFIDNDMSGTGDTVGLAFPETFATAGIHTLTDSFGAYALNYVPQADGTVIHGSTDPKMKDALAWLADLYAQGILDPQYGTRTKADVDELLVNGKLGIFTYAWSFGSSHKAIHEMNPDSDWLSFNLDNGSGKVNYPANLTSKDQFVVISKNCEHPEAVFKILAQQIAYAAMPAAEREAQFPELYAQLAAGMGGQARPFFLDILDINFTYQQQTYPTLAYLEDGTIVEGFNPESSKYLNAWNTYHADPTTMVSSDWVLYLSRFAGGAYHAYKLNQADLYEKSSTIYNQVPSMMDTPVDFTGMMAEYFIKIVTGELPLDAFDQYVAERNSQGDATICQELAESIG